ncbi:MAG: MMPL family transporter [Acidimicrobiales bacterium]
MTRFFTGLGRFVVRFRILIVVLWVVVLVVSTKALPSLSSEVNNDNSQFLPASAPSSKAASLATPILGNAQTESTIIAVGLDRSGPLTSADQAALAREVVVARHVPRVISARELAVSHDGRAAELVIDVQVNQADITAQTTVIDNLQATFAKIAAPPSLEVRLAGPIATNVANKASSAKAGNETQSLSFIFIIILLLVIFRSLLAPLVTLLPPAFALGISTRFIGGLGANGLKISEITELLLIVLLLGAGTDYGLFLVFRVREEIRRGLDAKSAVDHALVRVGESISASAGTVIIALLTLLLASFGIYKDLGLPLALGVAVMLLAGLTLLPALLAIFGKAVFWPSKLTSDANRAGAWGRVATGLVRHPARTLGIGIVVFAALAASALGFRSGGFGGALNAPPGTDAAAGNAILAQHFPQSSSNPANLVFAYAQPVWDRPAAVVTAETALRSSGQFRQLAGPLDPNGTLLAPALYAKLHRELGAPRALKPIEPAGLRIPVAEYNAYRSTALFVSPDGRTIQFEATLVAGGQQTTAALDATPHIRSVVSLAAARSGARADGVAGEAAALYDVSSSSNHDLIHIIPIAILAIAILLALVLRSVVAPLYLIVSVALSYLAALGVSTILFIDIGGSSGLTFILPFLMFIFLLALGEDYNILVMTRIREEAHVRPLRQAVVRAVSRTGPTVSSAGLVLAGTFGVLALSAGSGPSSGQVRDIGAGIAIGILMDTFLVRTLLVPSTVALLGRWNWWPAKVGVDGAPLSGEGPDEGGDGTGDDVAEGVELAPLD